MIQEPKPHSTSDCARANRIRHVAESLPGCSFSIRGTTWSENLRKCWVCWNYQSIEVKIKLKLSKRKHTHTKHCTQLFMEAILKGSKAGNGPDVLPQVDVKHAAIVHPLQNKHYTASRKSTSWYLPPLGGLFREPGWVKTGDLKWWHSR